MKVVVQLLGFEGEGSRKLCLTAVVDAGRQHANDGVRFPVNPHGMADQLWIGAEMRPQLVGQDHDMVLAVHSFFRQKVAAKKKGKPHHVVVPRRHLYPVDILRLVFAGNVERCAAKRIQVPERGTLPLPVGEVSRRDPVMVRLDLRPHDHQLFGMCIRQGSKQGSVVDSEDSRIGADAQGKGKEDRERKTRILPQHAHGVTDIAKNCLHGLASLSKLRLQLRAILRLLSSTLGQAGMFP